MVKKTDKHLFSKEQIVSEILTKIPKKRIVQEFAYQYLNAMSLRLLNSYDVTTFATFIKQRFDFFNSKDKDEPFFRIEPKLDGEVLSDDVYFFESVCPDASYVIVTLEALFRSFGLKMSQKIHPMMGVKFKGDTISCFESPSENSTLFSLVYFEFERVENDEIFKILRLKIAECLKAVLAVKNDQIMMLEKLDFVKGIILSNEKESPAITQEWGNLIDWLKDSNFSLFGYIPIDHDETDPVLNLSANEKKVWVFCIKPIKNMILLI